MERIRREQTKGNSSKALGRIVAATGALFVLVPVTGLGLPPQSASATNARTESAAPRVVSPAGTALKSCFWRGPVDGRGRKNAAFPDLDATYWTATFSLPAGARLNLEGSYPHARYMSFNSYDQSGVATSSIDDVAVIPDPGSTDPFLAGANRTATARSYSLAVLDQPTPTHPAANTLYAGVVGQTTEILIYRVYIADQGAGSTGGVGLPQMSVTMADGSSITGAKACKALGASKQLPPSQAFPLSLYLSLRGSVATFPATDPPAFWREFSISSLVNCVYLGSCGGTPALAPGQYSNLDNAYAVAMVNRGYSDGPVLVLHGVMPITPKTSGGELTVPSGVDLRYWSLCQNESLATTKVASCVDDEQVPVDASGHYTIVTSTSRDRPKNATTQCGVAWLKWPRNGDGAGHLGDGMLILRNLLPSPGFASAIQDVTQPGKESAVMGSYLPTGTYTTKRTFQSLGCP